MSLKARYGNEPNDNELTSKEFALYQDVRREQHRNGGRFSTVLLHIRDYMGSGIDTLGLFIYSG